MHLFWFQMFQKNNLELISFTLRLGVEGNMFADVKTK